MVTAKKLTPTGPRPGDRVGPYRLLEPLGEGGVAFVFRARHELSGEIVAVKAARAAREGLLASIRREMHALERLRHPGVVKILEGGVSEGRPWYAMELLRGDTLRMHLRTQVNSEVRVAGGTVSSSPSGAEDTLLDGPQAPISHVSGPTGDALPRSSLPVGAHDNLGWLLTLIRRLCEPLAYIHGEGIIHRDLTPGNVFVLPDGTPVLMDFGLVWRLQDEGRREVLSIDASQAGTIAYMAPEQARGKRLDARADLFSLGCIMYEAITGLLPFTARSWPELIAAHVGEPPLPLSELVPGVPQALDELVMGLLEPQARDRIGHAADVAAALADLGAAGWREPTGVQVKAYLYRPELVGRGKLLDQALQHVVRLEEERGGCLLVGGESGIGKTSFAFEVARLAALRSIRVVTCECMALGVADGKGVRRAGAFYPFSRLLQAVADRCVSGGRELTARMLGDRAKVLAVVEPSLRNLPGVEGRPEPAEVPGEAARRRLMDALAETLAEFASEQLTLLVIDDLQWADDLTLMFLASLSERYFAATRLLILGTYRSEEMGGALERMVTQAADSNLRLDRLDSVAVRAMAADMLGRRDLAQKLAAFLIEESSGNPFFVAEYLRAAVDADLLFRDERGRWHQADDTTSPEGLSLPRTLTALVIRRLELLPSEARELAEMAAVLGRAVEVELLRSLALRVGRGAGESEQSSRARVFEESLRALLVRDVLELTAAGSVRFVHDKLREIGYEELTPERQCELHRAAALLLEQQHTAGQTLERAYATLAHHFERAGEDEKALTYLDKAAQAADAMHANQEAVRLLSQAQRLDERLGSKTSTVNRARRERMLGLNALALGDVNLALASLTEAASTAGRPWPDSRWALAWRCLIHLGSEFGRRCARLVRARLPTPKEPARELLLEASRDYERLLVVHFWVTGDMPSVVLCALTSMGLAERAGGASGERALGYAGFGVMCSFAGLDCLARYYGRQAIEVAAQSGDAVAETWTLMNVATVHLQAGRWGAVSECLEHARAKAKAIGFNRRWEESTTLASTACFVRGDFAASERLNAEFMGAVERADPQSKCWAVVRQAELHLVKGEVGRALALAREGEKLCLEGLGRAEWIFTLGPLALASLRHGDSRGARAAADSCLEWMAKGSAPIFYNVFAHSAVTEVYFSLWKAAPYDAEKRRFANLARKALRQLQLLARGVMIALPKAKYWQGVEALELDGKRDLAARFFRESLERANRFDMPHDQGLVVAALGANALGDDEQVASWFAEAAATFQRIGALHDLEQVARLSRSRPLPRSVG